MPRKLTALRLADELKVPNVAIVVLGGASHASVGWAISWSKTRIRRLSQQIRKSTIQRERDKQRERFIDTTLRFEDGAPISSDPHETKPQSVVYDRHYHFAVTGKNVSDIDLNLSAYSGLWTITITSDPIDEIERATSIVRSRLSPFSIPGSSIHVNAIELSGSGDPINAVGGGALGPGLLLTETLGGGVETDQTVVFTEIARQGQSDPTNSAIGDKLNAIIFNLPSALTNLGYPSFYTGSLEPIYYEQATGLVTAVMTSTTIPNIVDPLPGGFEELAEAGGTATKQMVGQSIMFTFAVADLLAASLAPSQGGQFGWAESTTNNVAIGATTTISWNGLVIVTGAVPVEGEVDPEEPLVPGQGDFTVNFVNTLLTATNGLALTFGTRITGTLVDGIATVVTGILTSAKVGTGVAPTGNKDFAVQYPVIVDDVRPTVQSALSIAEKNTGFILPPGRRSYGQYSPGEAARIPSDGTGFFVFGQGCPVNGVPIPNAADTLYKYQGDLSVRGLLTPTNTLGVSVCELFDVRSTGETYSTSVKYRIMEGLYIDWHANKAERGSYNSISTLQNDPRASYRDVTNSHKIVRIRWSNGNASSTTINDNSSTGIAAGALGAVAFLQVNDGTINHATISFNGLPNRGNNGTQSLGSGGGFGYTNPPDFGSPGPPDNTRPGTHSLFSTLKTSEELSIVDPGPTNISSGVFHDNISGFSIVADQVVDNPRWQLMNSSADIVTVQRGGFNVRNFNEMVLGVQGKGDYFNTYRLKSGVGRVVNNASWTTHGLLGAGFGLGWQIGFPASGSAKLFDSWISASDGGLPGAVPFHMMWVINNSTAGVFMAAPIDVEVYRGLYFAWRNAKLTQNRSPAPPSGNGEGEEDSAFVISKRDELIAGLNIFYNNFASDELIAAASYPFQGGSSADLLIIPEVIPVEEEP
jgi:hypothetical protein